MQKSFSSGASGASSLSASDTASGLVLSTAALCSAGEYWPDRLAGDLQHQPVPDDLTDLRDGRAIGLGVQAMPALRVAHVQVDHRGPALEALGGSPG